MTAHTSQVETLTPSEITAGFEMTLAAAEPSAEADERWAQRAEVLAQWLLAIWRSESPESER